VGVTYRTSGEVTAAARACERSEVTLPHARLAAGRLAPAALETQPERVRSEKARRPWPGKRADKPTGLRREARRARADPPGWPAL